MGATTAYRCFLGFTSATADASGEDPLLNLSGVILTTRSADTNWFIGCNNGSGSTTYTDTAVPRDTVIHTFEIICQSNLTNPFKYSLDGGPYVTITDTNIPAPNTELTVWAQIQTDAAAIKTMNLYALEVESI